ncbi:MAG: hypothetical protein M3P04_03475 [Actinomycetota bacterium]|nr:hypothetical protein [Actinomycetota bacterium]
MKPTSARRARTSASVLAVGLLCIVAVVGLIGVAGAAGSGTAPVVVTNSTSSPVPVTGTVNLGNLPANQAVHGTVTALTGAVTHPFRAYGNESLGTVSRVELGSVTVTNAESFAHRVTVVAENADGICAATQHLIDVEVAAQSTLHLDFPVPLDVQPDNSAGARCSLDPTSRVDLLISVDGVSGSSHTVWLTAVGYLP